MTNLCFKISEFQKPVSPTLKNKKTRFKFPTKLELLLMYLTLLSITFPLLISTHVLFSPSSLSHASSMAPKEFQKLAAFPFLLVQCWAFLASCSLMLIHSFSNILMGSVTLKLVSLELRPEQFTAKKKAPGLTILAGKDEISRAQNLRTMYRSLQIILNEMNSVIYWIAYPLEFLISKFCILCAVILIRFCPLLQPWERGMISLFLWGTGFIWLSMLQLGGSVFNQSKECTRTWKFFDWEKERRVMGKFRRSSPSLKLKSGMFGFMKKIKVLKFLKGFFKKTMKTLVAFGK